MALNSSFLCPSWSCAQMSPGCICSCLKLLMTGFRRPFNHRWPVSRYFHVSHNNLSWDNLQMFDVQLDRAEVSAVPKWQIEQCSRMLMPSWAWISSYLFFHMIHTVSCLLIFGLNDLRHKCKIKEGLDLQVFVLCVFLMLSRRSEAETTLDRWAKKKRLPYYFSPIVLSPQEQCVSVSECVQGCTCICIKRLSHVYHTYIS